jgi:hypothetical protein
MESNYATSNRFEGLDVDEETPVKRPNNKPTPERFKPAPKGNSVPDVTGAVGQIERINRARQLSPPVKEAEQRKRPSGKKDGSMQPPTNAWIKPLIPKVGRGPRVAPKPNGKAAELAIVVKDAIVAPAVKLMKVEPIARPRADTEFYEALKADAPDLVAQIEKEDADDNRPWYTVEVVCIPDPAWELTDEGPDLERFEVERKLLQALAANAGPIADHSIKLEVIKSLKQEGMLRKRFYYQMSCTSESGLAAITAHSTSAEWRGYRISFYQPQDSRFGYRFQYNIAALPTPFSEYTVADWFQVCVSQGWDAGSITYMALGVVADPGQMNRRTGMIDIYVKPEACINHGCDGALHHAGTAMEVVGKVIDYPPSQLMLGRNPSPEAQELITAGMCMGQYFNDNPIMRPAQGDLNAMLEVQVGAYLPLQDFGKTWTRPTVKLSACRYCWGPKHEDRIPCMYKGLCKECVVDMKSLPWKGYHHACRSMVLYQPKADRKTTETANKRKHNLYDPGTPMNAGMAVYNQSSLRCKRQKILEDLKIKQLLRIAAEEAAVLAAAAEEADLLEYETFLAEGQSDEDPLTEQDIIIQDAALAQMDEQMGPIDIEMDNDI